VKPLAVSRPKIPYDEREDEKKVFKEKKNLHLIIQDPSQVRKSLHVDDSIPKGGHCICVLTPQV